MPLEFHPYADIFPLMNDADRAEQREDIRENGLREPIDIFDGKILDGRNRYLDLVDLSKGGAILGAGWGVYEGVTLGEDELAPTAGIWWFRRFIPEESGDPLDYVISKNLRRRHLSDNQRASVAAKLANLGRGRPQENPPIGGISTGKAAETLNVTERQVERAKVVHEHGVEGLRTALDQGNIAVSTAEQIARRPEEEQQQELQRRGLVDGPSPHMANRVEPDGSLNYFPTPPWVTRALMDVVIPYVEVWPDDLAAATCHEPACGEGHMSAVLEEYFGQVVASDIFDYSLDGRSPPGWEGVADFLAPEVSRPGADWIITNPPFNEQTAKFMAAAIDRAQVGVAIFLHLRYLEGIDRYETIFRDRPPTVVAFFVERAPLHMGRWEPDGGTMTAYVWLVWVKGRHPMPPLWIPPGQRERLTKPDDRERFTAHPVLPKGVTLEGEKYDEATGEFEEKDDGRGRSRGQNGGGGGEDRGRLQTPDQVSPTAGPVHRRGAARDDSHRSEISDLIESDAATATAESKSQPEPENALAEASAESTDAGEVQDPPQSTSPPLSESQAKANEGQSPENAARRGAGTEFASRLSDGRTSDATEVVGRDSRERPAPPPEDGREAVAAAAGNGSTLPTDRNPDTGAPGRGEGAPHTPVEKTVDGIPIFLLRDGQKVAAP